MHQTTNFKPVQNEKEVYNHCFDQCVQKISSRAKVKQEFCIERCIRKTITALDFLRAWDQKKGPNREFTLNENEFDRS